MTQKHFKYSRTYHLPYSLSRTDDDKTMKDDSCLQGKMVAVSIKFDGENTNVYGRTGFTHARSLDTSSHPSRDWLKSYIQSWVYDLDENLRVCGENVYALHSIHYANLKSYFYGFGLYEGTMCLDLQTTLEIFELLGIHHSPIFYQGIYDKDKILQAFQAYQQGLGIVPEGCGLPAKIINGQVEYLSHTSIAEGFVIRNVEAFDMNDFKSNVGKFVRAGHVQTDEHWSKYCIPNKCS